MAAEVIADVKIRSDVRCQLIKLLSQDMHNQNLLKLAQTLLPNANLLLEAKNELVIQKIEEYLQAFLPDTLYLSQSDHYDNQVNFNFEVKKEEAFFAHRKELRQFVNELSVVYDVIISVDYLLYDYADPKKIEGKVEGKLPVIEENIFSDVVIV